MDDDDVHDTEAGPSDWTGAGEDAAQAVQPFDTENEPVVFQMEAIGAPRHFASPEDVQHDHPQLGSGAMYDNPLGRSSREKDIK
eukprot:4672142-Amphidinium_carterae.1